jgi:peptidoglycan-associated lipoprotein
MVQRRGPAFLVVPLLLLTLFLAGCPKRPATTGAVAPAPTAPMAAPAAPAPAAPAPMQPATAQPTPAAPAPRPSEFALNDNLKTIYFDFDKYDIRPADAKLLDGNATWLKSNGDNLLLIEGHCDERGTNEYNLALGERRALSVRRYLVSLGVNPDRVHTISYGEERPLDPAHTDAAWAMNRRGEFKVTAAE